MPITATRALLFACATLACSACYPEPTSYEDGSTARVHEPWAPAFAPGGSATGGLATGGSAASGDGDGNPTAGSGAAGASAGTAAGTSAGGAPTTAPVGCSPGRFVLVDHLRNARDMGGTPLHPEGAMSCGAVYRGPPLAVSAAGCTAAATLGIRTLIDLRTDSERSSNPDAACVSAERVFAPLPIPYGLGPADYLNDLHETASIALVFHTFGDPAAYPIYFHCTFGRDRTGIVGALLLLTLGATRSAVMQEYMLSQPNVGAYPNALDAVLDEIEQRGGAETVLKSIGITDEELAVMRAHAL
jgi:protein-tyrosine phosphatase